jgi:hypothetical protein
MSGNHKYQIPNPKKISNGLGVEIRANIEDFNLQTCLAFGLWGLGFGILKG